VTPEPTVQEERKVYAVSAFNRGVAQWLERLPTVWVEGEVTEFRRQPGWQSVFFTLKDPADGSCLPVSMPRAGFDALRIDLDDGASIQVFGRPELYAARGTFRLRALSLEPVGLGALAARIERLRRTLAAEGLFAEERKRPLPLLPRRIGLLTGSEAAAKRDFVTAVGTRFPAARILVSETAVQGARAPGLIAAALEALAAEPEIDVIVLARGGGSFEDLLPFSAEQVVRAVASSPVPVVSAVGHEQDTPLCDLAADARASTPTAAARLVVPDEGELRAGLAALRAALARETTRKVGDAAERIGVLRSSLAREGTHAFARARERLLADHGRLVKAPTLLVERRREALEALAARLRTLSPRSTLERGYAIVRLDDAIVRRTATLATGARVEVELAEGGFGARVEEIR
jgi:exodeoxyribonuclease VII large subunit